MKLYVWTEVLCDYTAGMIVALVPDIETALELARKSKYSDVVAEEMGRVEPEVTELPGCEGIASRLWLVHGGG